VKKRDIVLGKFMIGGLGFEDMRGDIAGFNGWGTSAEPGTI